MAINQVLWNDLRRTSERDYQKVSRRDWYWKTTRSATTLMTSCQCAMSSRSQCRFTPRHEMSLITDEQYLRLSPRLDLPFFRAPIGTHSQDRRDVEETRNQDEAASIRATTGSRKRHGAPCTCGQMSKPTPRSARRL